MGAQGDMLPLEPMLTVPQRAPPQEEHPSQPACVESPSSYNPFLHLTLEEELAHTLESSIYMFKHDGPGGTKVLQPSQAQEHMVLVGPNHVQTAQGLAHVKPSDY